MAQTVIGLNDQKAVKRYSGNLAVDAPHASYWGSKFMESGEDPNTPLQKLTDLRKAKGECIYFDLSMSMNMAPVEGDAVLHGKEEGLSFFSANVYIDQMRGGLNTGGRMTQQRTLHDLRSVARKRQTEWWGKVYDELIFMYLSGARGVNTGWVYDSSYAGFANNSLTAPDTDHLVYGGTATSKATVAATDKMSTLPIDRAVAYAEMMGGGGPAYSEVPKIQPCKVEGEMMFLLIMNPWQKFDLRRNTTTNDWADITKAIAMSVGRSTEFLKGGLGIWNGVVLHSHQNVVQFSDYGAGSNVAACRALFCGKQAGAIAWGNAGDNMRFEWHEEDRDNGNQVVITSGSMWGIVKTTFNGHDFGVMAIDTAATKP